MLAVGRSKTTRSDKKVNVEYRSQTAVKREWRWKRELNTVNRHRTKPAAFVAPVRLSCVCDCSDHLRDVDGKRYIYLHRIVERLFLAVFVVSLWLVFLDNIFLSTKDLGSKSNVKKSKGTFMFAKIIRFAFYPAWKSFLVKQIPPQLMVDLGLSFHLTKLGCPWTVSDCNSQAGLLQCWIKVEPCSWSWLANLQYLIWF